MRIYFVGSHATGKTTLCRYVSRRYGLPMITEVARAVLAEMETSLDALRTDVDLVAEYQERVFHRQVAIEQLHEGHFVSDRAFDNLAYAAEHTVVVADLMGDDRFREYMKWVSKGTVFFLRPHQSLLKEDGVRAGVTWESVLRIDGMVKLLLEQHRVSYLPIESVSMQERVRAVDFVLQRAGLEAALTPRQQAAAALAAGKKGATVNAGAGAIGSAGKKGGKAATRGKPSAAGNGNGNGNGTNGHSGNGHDHLSGLDSLLAAFRN